MATSPFTLGWVHNLHEPVLFSQAETLIGVSISFSVFSFLFLALRLGLRVKDKQLGLDDLAAFSSFLLGVAYTVLAIIQTKWGLGIPPSQMPRQDFDTFRKIQFSGLPVYCLALLGFKLSILLFYIRIAGNAPVYRRLLYIAVGVVTANQLIFTCLLSFACRPLAKQWDFDLPGTCINQLATYFALAATSLIFDLFISALAFPALRRLHLNRSKKIAIAGIFSLALFMTIIQGIRLFFVANLTDYLNSIKIIGWSVVEINLGVVISCFATFGKLFKPLFGDSPQHVMSPPINMHGHAPQEKLPIYHRRRDTFGDTNSATSVESTTDNLWKGNSSAARSYFAVHSSQNNSPPPEEEIGFDKSLSPSGIHKVTKVSVDFEYLDGTKL